MNALPMPSLELLRNNYALAASDKKLCRDMIVQLEAIPAGNSIHLGYLGAYQAVMAQHYFNPLDKLATFNKGKKNIENAIKQSPNEPELRFVRLSIQKNCPRFLGYHRNIAEDELFLRQSLREITPPQLRKMVLEIL